MRGGAFLYFFPFSRRWVLPALLFVLGAAVYSSSLGGTFLLDDIPQIVENPYLRRISWPFPLLGNTRRPLLYLTLAVNYQLGGLAPWGYHLFNILVHLAAGLLVFGSMRRVAGRLAGWSGAAADGPAFWTALLWMVHPLTIPAVTYVIQRSESLAALAYLLVFYAALRYLGGAGRTWAWCSILACLAGGLVKETLVTAPVLVWLYDRLSGGAGWRAALRRHRLLYFGYGLAWLVMGYLWATAHPESLPTAGFGLAGVSPWQYLLSQPPVIVHYLRLVIWPWPLILDYGWQPGQDGLPLWAALLVLIGGTAGIVLAGRGRPGVVFLVSAFFFDPGAVLQCDPA